MTRKAERGGPANATTEAKPASSHPSIGLALGSGGAKGIAHVVVLETFDELGIRPSIIAGASIGSIAGAIYAGGMSGREIRDYLLEGISHPAGVMADVLSCHVGGLHDLFTMAGNPVLLDAERLMERLLPKQLPKRFEDLAIPLIAVATDFYRKEQALFESGRLQTALAASMAIPGLFKPVLSQGRVLIDGGITNPLPFDLLVNRTDVVVAIDINGAPREGDRPGGLVPRPLDVLFASVQITAHAMVQEKIARHPPTIILHPDITRYRVLDFLEAREILQSAEPLRDKLKRALDPFLSQT